MSRIFISYAREDSQAARRLYEDLKAKGLEPWLDAVDLLPGTPWRKAIKDAIKESTHFVAVMSSESVAKQGFVQKELREALEVLEEVPGDQIFLIPARLDECEPTHPELRELQWVDLFPSYEASLGRIVHAIQSTRRRRAKISEETHPRAKSLEEVTLAELENRIRKAERALAADRIQLKEAFEEDNPHTDQVEEAVSDMADEVGRLHIEKWHREWSGSTRISSTQQKILAALTDGPMSKKALAYKLRAIYHSVTRASGVNRSLNELADVGLVSAEDFSALRLTEQGRDVIARHPWYGTK